MLRVNAITDPLTGLYNRRFLIDHLAREISRAERSEGDRLAVAMMDLKGFKSINDRLGHPVGDSVLVRTARVVRESLRAIDAGCRWGGDEFVARPAQHRHDRRRSPSPSACASADRRDVAAGPRRARRSTCTTASRPIRTTARAWTSCSRSRTCGSTSAARSPASPAPSGGCTRGSRRRTMSVRMDWQGADRTVTAPVVDVSYGGLAFRARRSGEVAAALEGGDRPAARSRASPGQAARAELRRRCRAAACASGARMSETRDRLTSHGSGGARLKDAAFAAHRAAASGLFPSSPSSPSSSAGRRASARAGGRRRARDAVRS